MTHQSDPPQRPPVLATLAVFALVYVIAQLPVSLLAKAAGTSAGSLGAIVALVGSAMFAGMRYAKRSGAPASGTRLLVLVLASYLIVLFASFFVPLVAVVAAGGSMHEASEYFLAVLSMLASLEGSALVTALLHLVGFNSFLLLVGYAWLTPLFSKRQDGRS